VWYNVPLSRYHSRTKERLIQRVPFEISFENKGTFETTCPFREVIRGQKNVWYNVSLSRGHSRIKERLIQRVPLDTSFEYKGTFDATCPFRDIIWRQMTFDTRFPFLDIIRGKRNVWYNVSLSRYHSTTKERLIQCVHFEIYISQINPLPV
jgi:hypothetical protein